MSLTSRVIWQEGMFLRAQHFQQQDRWAEHLVRGLHRSLGPNHWGFRELVIAREGLDAGRIELARAAGVFDDGTPFSFPDPDEDAEAPPPLSLGTGTGTLNATIFLALASPGPRGVLVGESERDPRRLKRTPQKARDTHPAEAGEGEEADLDVGRLRLRLLREGDDGLLGCTRIAVARVEKVSPDRKVSLDAGFIPPILSCHAAPRLGGFLPELAGMIRQVGASHAARLGEGPIGPHVDEADFKLLQVANRWLPLIQHWADTGAVHPERVYEGLTQLAGEWATFTSPTHRPDDFPPYRHDDLQSSFGPLIDALRRAIPTGIGPGVTELPLIELGQSRWRADIADRSLLAGAFFLVVRANMPREDVQRLFPAQVKIGPLEKMRGLVASAVSGIAVAPVSPPRQLPFIAGALYFELDRSTPFFTELQNSPAIGFHLSSEFPGLRLQLWSVRG
jgi:type VI secretion system protein ImpJ